MPFKSDKQRKMFYAAAEGKSDKVSPEVAKKFIKDSSKERFKKLKEQIKKK